MATAGRPVSLKGGGKRRKPLNASLPTQLVLDFNATASSKGHGMRDALLQEVLLSFLAKIDPDSKSVQQLIPSGQLPRTARVSAPEARLMLERAKEQEAIRISRDCAQTILDVTAGPGRKPPKRSPQAVVNRKRKVS